MNLASSNCFSPFLIAAQQAERRSGLAAQRNSAASETVTSAGRYNCTPKTGLIYFENYVEIN